jgi:hypothetical protein
MAPLTTAQTIQIEQQAKQFTLQDSSSSTRIVFYPRAPLSGTDGATPGAQLDYHGPEGVFTFRGQDIEQQENALGQLITVMLKPDADAGQLDFTLVLPMVFMGGKKAQEIATVAIKTKGIGHVINPAGADRTYRVLQLSGMAAAVIQPL